MKLRFLGTGTSFGIPVIGCSCQACTSSDPRDSRTRHGALLQSDDARCTVLVDTPPELRLQLLAARVSHLDAVWFTHEHADHTHGIDDLRIFSHDATRMLPAFAEERCAQFMRRKFDYIFNEDYQPIGGPKVNLHLQAFRELELVQVAEFEMLPLAFPHGDVDTYGFRVGDLGYVTDAKQVPDHARRALRGIRVLVLNALWFGKSHATHMTIEEAVQTARELGAERTYLTHLTHRVVHADAEAMLPPQVRLAYDGLVVEI
ncbi:MAG TPA: MBL fold metallo-hydrolase [Longimicrobiales bacterium]